MAYHYGNLAMKPKRKEQQDYVIRETRKKVIRRKPIPAGEKMLYLLTVLGVAVVASIIIFKYAQLYDISLHIKQVNSEIQSFQIEREQLQREVQTLSNPERIRQFAQENGMSSSLDNGIVVNKSSVLEGMAKLE